MPSPKPSDIFQGSDWLTYRWTVAQAFDTLDRIRDLCLQMPVSAAGSAPAGQPHFDIPEEDIADMFGYVVELCDDLTGELDCVHADLAPPLAGSLPHAWFAFEMWLHLREMRAMALKEANSAAPLQALPDPILAYAGRIRALLKQIDQ
jgi:hypothetical protein